MPVFAGTAAADRLVGSAAADQIYGLGLNDKLYGGGGNDWLVGGLGGDFLVGGLGDDAYDVDSVRDQVVERAFEGIDRVRAWISYELTANVEILTLAGTANLNGTGNAKDNTILGNAGNNVLNGGAGDDVLIGGKGNDAYYVNSAGDLVVEAAGEGRDQVRALISYQLRANFEDLILGGTGNLIGTGNALDNTIIGNAGNNVLNGGAGNDVLIGRGGNDVYDVDTTRDQIQEAADEGYDRVRSSVSFTLGAYIEDLNLTGTKAINGTGNALANTIVGNAGINVLGGGAGDDRLFGGDGDDDLHGGAGKDYLEGGAGNDWLVENKINMMAGEVYDGGDGHDTLWVRGNFSESIDISTMFLSNFEDIISDFQTTRISSAQITSISSFVASTVQISDGGNLDLSNLVADFDRINLSDMGNNLTLRLMGPFFFEPVVYGGLGTDTVVGGNSGNEIHGGGGNDSITGGTQFDELFGDSGDDVIRGGGGGDGIVGGKGNDQLTGGSGGDSFKFGINEGIDTIVDFRSSQGDSFFLPNLLNGEFVYLGSADFTGAGNSEARFAAGQVFVDADGNGTTDITIRLTGITAASQLHESNFVFW